MTDSEARAIAAEICAADPRLESVVLRDIPRASIGICIKCRRCIYGGEWWTWIAEDAEPRVPAGFVDMTIGHSCVIEVKYRT